MYQSEASRFVRTKSNDLTITFLPLLLAFGLRGVLKTMKIPGNIFMAIQVFLACFLVAVFVLSYRFYFRTFRYTIVDRDAKRSDSRCQFPKGSLTFERLMGDKARIYERVMASEMLCLLEPNQTYDAARFGTPSKTYNLRAKAPATAYRLYYQQEGIVYCARFHPDEQQVSVLRSWINPAR